MSDTDLILQALKDHRAETRQDMHELRGAVVKIADAAADMGKTMARSEERHGHHEEATRRMGRAIDDHEARLRTLEHDTASADQQRTQGEAISDLNMRVSTGRTSVSAGWKVITVIGTALLGAGTLISLLIKSVPK